MKKIILCLALTLLSGCSTVNKITDMLPKKHDPMLASYYIDTKLKVESLTCDKPDGWQDTIQTANKLAAYTEFRKDPQKDNAAATTGTNIDVYAAINWQEIT